MGRFFQRAGAAARPRRGNQVADAVKERVVVDMRGVSLWRNRMLLDDVNWRVNRGEHWVVLGRNGAGKTLLLKILAGYLWPSRGTVSVLAERFGGVDLRALRRSIGWVSAALGEKIPGRDTATEVVLSGAYATFGLYERPEDDLVEAAAGLMADMGLSALSEQRYADLSAGEKQRVLLARGRLARPALLILDEPCAGLDLAAREKLLALVEAMAADPEGPTMLMVTHRVVEIMPGFTHALLLHQGRVLGAGPVDQVLTEGLFSRAMEIPCRIVRHRGRYRVETA